MSHTERLIDCSNNPLARELLRTAEMDMAPENTAAKVALALGLGSSAVITTVAASAAASGGLASGTSSTMVASAVAAAPAGVAAAAPVAAGAVAAAPVAAGAVAAAPVAAGAVTAVGMLKVMAAVSLACGTLSYGGVKLALKVTEKPAVTEQAAVQKLAPVTRSALAKTAARSVAAFPDVQDPEPVPEANLPAPPPPPNTDDEHISNDVAAAREPEPRLASATPDTARRVVNPAVLGRHDIQESGTRNAAPPHTERKIETVVPTQPVAPIAHAASFPSEEAHPAPPVPVASAPSPASNLEREVAQLDHARAALAAGQPVQALRELDVYRAQTPRGILAAESVVLRVKALLALGQRSAAEAEARPLLVNAPQSRHAERLRSLLGAAANPQ